MLPREFLDFLGDLRPAAWVARLALLESAGIRFTFFERHAASVLLSALH
jgi:hypothetical protein